MDLDIYILSRNRPDFLRQTVESFLAEGVEAHLIVSDNSTNNDVETLCADVFPNIKYIRRSPPVAVFDHLNMVLNESKSKYIVLFHDDDLVCAGYVKSMVAVLDTNPAVGAVACNAQIISSHGEKGFSILRLNKNLFISHPRVLLEKYMRFFSVAAAPFPSYMYRKKSIDIFKPVCGKYSDVAYLLEILNNGAQIVWLKDILIYYRRHDGNDSNGESVRDRGKLRCYLTEKFGMQRSDPLIMRYRLKYLMYLVKSGRINLRKEKKSSFFTIVKYMLFVMLTSFLNLKK